MLSGDKGGHSLVNQFKRNDQINGDKDSNWQQRVFHKPIFLSKARGKVMGEIRRFFLASSDKTDALVNKYGVQAEVCFFTQSEWFGWGDLFRMPWVMVIFDSTIQTIIIDDLQNNS